MKLHSKRSRSLPLNYFVTPRAGFCWVYLCLGSKVLGPISRCRVADILPRMNLVSHASRPGLTVVFQCFATGCVLLRDFTLRIMNKRVELDVRMNPTLFTMSDLSCTTCLHFHRKYKHFYFEGVNYFMQLQFLAPVGFFKQLNGCSF